MMPVNLNWLLISSASSCQPDPMSARDDLNRTRLTAIADAAGRAANYITGGADRRIAPHPDAVRQLATLDRAVPDFGRSAAEVLETLDRVGSPATTMQIQGRFFGFVNGGVDPAAQAASMLTSAWDQNAALPVMSPAAAQFDEVAALWVTQLLGLPSSSVATFCGGCTVANFTAIVAARDVLLERKGWSVAERGLVGAPAIKVVTSDETHISVLKSLRLAGLGRDNIRFVPCDEFGRMRAEQLGDVDDMTLAVLQAGNVNTGYSDPFADVIPVIEAAGGWTHVDGAFGLWAAVSPTRRESVRGVELADSWATDAHKWLNAPYDSGIVICKRIDDLRRAMMIEASYLATTDPRPLMHLSIQMSQGARGTLTWAALSSLGRQGVVELIDRTSDLAARFAQQLGEAGANVLVPPIINQAIVQFTDDATTDAVISAVQQEGTCWLGGSTWHGKRVMRISVSDMATTEADIDASAAAVIRCWKAL
jgi:glutamate/tyrosine decarboxylase-like PLP-dependent enzyme